MSLTEVGKQGEALACKYLQDHGFKIRQKNFRCRLGEIDLIAQKGEDIFFVEVKTRRSASYGSPWSAVTNKKQQKIINVARYYIVGLKQNFNYHFAVIGVELDIPQGKHNVDFLADAFVYDGG